jgi:hypothetical protein
VIRTKFPLAFTALFIFSVLNWHCTKIDTTSIGSSLIPAVDNVNTFDTTLNVVANNFDSLGSAGKVCATIYPTDEHALGYIGNDPYFGTTTATIYTELKPVFYPFYFQGTPFTRTLDSVVLVLSYKRTYGDPTIPQSVNVYKLSDAVPFTPDSSTCSAYPYTTKIGSATYSLQNLSDSIKHVIGDTAAVNQLRIKLDPSFGQSLLARDTIKSDSLFKAFLKGFAIVPNPVGNALTYYDITSVNTQLAVYYKYKRANLADTNAVDHFNLSVGSGSANQIVRSRGGAEITNAANKNNPAGDNFVYIQTAPGSYATVKIPGLDVLSNRIIHRAELIMEQASPTALDNVLVPPSFLYLDLGDSLRPIPCDLTLIQGQPDLRTFGGNRDSTKDASGKIVAKYTFNISRYVQKIVTNHRKNSVLRLSAPSYVYNPLNYVDECGQGVPVFLSPFNFVAYGRVKLVGGTLTGTAVNRMRLHIIYSKL